MAAGRAQTARMTRCGFLRSLGCGSLLGTLASVKGSGAGTRARKGVVKAPNIVYLLADDLGYGDVHCLNPRRGRIPTPNLDRLAERGMTFTDAHSGSAVCTPTRYGVLTGRYCWRTRLQRGVLGGYSLPLISERRMTVASLLRSNGYRTALFGKWHLGLDWPRVDASRPPGCNGEELTVGDVLSREAQQKLDNVDYRRAIRGGPAALGFDYFYGVSAPNLAPFVWIENDHVLGEPTQVQRVMYTGIGQPGYRAEDILPSLTRRVRQHLDERGAANAGEPFFLAFMLTAPHSPLVPTKEWLGRSGLGLYGDFVMQTDSAVGQVLNALERNGLAGNTLVIVSSDNGCAPYVGVRDRFGDDVRGHTRGLTAVHELERAGHYPSAEYRGYKSDVWDGGHRVPFIAAWPGVVEPGTTCKQLTCLTDLLATCAEIAGAKLPDGAGEDSISILPLLSGKPGPVRDAVVHHSAQGRFAIRQENWKLVLGPGSGGWSQPNDKAAVEEGLPSIQLYDMSADAGEQVNLQDKHPDVVSRLSRLLEKYVAEGRSTRGPRQANDVTVDIWKGPAYREKAATVEGPPGV